MSNSTRLFDRLADLHNKASDTNFVWFPLIFLRPKPHQEIKMLRRICMALLFGFYYGLFYLLKKILFDKSLVVEMVFQNTLYAVVGFFIWFNLVTAPLWNRRARAISRSKLNEDNTIKK